MTPGGGTSRLILVIDLRTEGLATLTSGRFSEVQAARAPSGNAQWVDFRRVIMVDRASELTAHGDVFSHVLNSHIDVSILCVAVGAPPADDPTIALRRPYQLGPPKVATLWIGDVYGIGWQTGSMLADSVNMPKGDSAAAADQVPHELLEILGLPQVFDHVVHSVAAMPGAAASPGFRTIRGEITRDVLADAERSAIRQFTGTDNAVIDLPEDFDGGPEKSLSARGGRSHEVIRPGGRVDELHQRARKAGQQATAVMRRISRPEALLGAEGDNARGALSSFADALTELTDLAAWVLDHVDTSTGFDAGHRQDLDELGIEVGEPRTAETEHNIEVLTGRTLDAIDQLQPLPALADRLREASERFRPAGTASYRSRLKQVCPPDLIAALRKPPPLITGSPVGKLLATTVAAGLVSSLWPPHYLLGGISIVLAAVVAFRIMVRAARITPLRRSSAAAFFTGHMVAAALGAVVGTAIALAARLPASGLIWEAIGVAVTIALPVVVGLLYWRTLSGRWWGALHVTRLFSMPEIIRGLIGDVARNEWREAAARAVVFNHARALASSLADSAEAIRQHAINPPAAGAGTRRTPRRHADHDQVSQELVMIDLAAAVATVVERFTEANEPHGLASVDGQAIKRDVSGLLDEYVVHLSAAGLPEPPSFTRPSERRALLVESLMERGTELRDAIRTTVTDERITQLCAPEHLTLLETDTRQIDLLRFAPRSAESFLNSQRPITTGAERPVIWTRASSVAGVLRLVPLRSGAVRSVMSKTPDADSGGLSDGTASDAGSTGRTEGPANV